MGAEQRLEASALIGVQEAVQHDGVLTHVGVDVQEDLGADRADRGHHRRGYRDPVPDSVHVDQHLTGTGSVDQRPPERPDHRGSPITAATARRSGCAVR